MSRQLRSLPAGSSVAFVTPTRASSTELVIPNYGITDVSTQGEFTMAPPDAGVRKTLFYASSSTSATAVVRFSTAATVKGSLAGATQITFAGTVDCVVELIGINSTRWAVISAYPPGAAVNSTGIIVGTS